MTIFMLYYKPHVVATILSMHQLKFQRLVKKKQSYEGLTIKII